ncbi:MAG: hypothetical protein HY237_06665 [Acidobacteria bacterium]|nr:hypothetical protein [Acidobacteriota bacterium]
MDKENRFSQAVSDKLKCYVYRLIDPRSGITFYVGRGRGNRLFSHAAGDEKPSRSEDAESLKIRMIREIRNDGFQVQHVIHRHGMNEESAKEVEAALIDAYPGLTNIQPGYESDRGAMHATQVIRLYEAEEAKFVHNVVLLKIHRAIQERPIIDAVRYAWNINQNRARKQDYVLAVANGMIVGAYVADEWLPATPENFPGFPPLSPDRKKFGFRGHEAPEDVKAMYIQKRVPPTKRGEAGVIHYKGPASRSK